MLKKEWNIICSAFLFFTRVKFPFKVPYVKENISYITAYLPLIGIFVGGLAALFFKLLVILSIPKLVSIILVLVLVLLLTGALHEDGFADVLDGFGGGYTKERILDIMQDSSIGTYGTLGIIFLIIIKVALLFYIPIEWLPIVLVITHSLSRWGLLFITYFWNYVRLTGKSKSREVVKKLSVIRILFASAIAVLPLLLFPNRIIWLLIIIVPLVSILCGKYFYGKIEGYTGDCLGANQQINEIIILLFVCFFTLNDIVF